MIGMKLFFLSLALIAGQMNTLQPKPVVHLRPNQNLIDTGFGGKLLELTNPPSTVRLPIHPEKVDDEGNPWCIDVKNLGPGAAMVTGKMEFRVEVRTGQTVHICSNGRGYSLNPGGSQ